MFISTWFISLDIQILGGQQEESNGRDFSTLLSYILFLYAITVFFINGRIFLSTRKTCVKAGCQGKTMHATPNFSAPRVAKLFRNECQALP